MKQLINMAAFAAAIVFPSCSYAGTCKIDAYYFAYGTDTSTHMTVKSGTICGRTMNVYGGVTSLSITQPPQNGSAATSNSKHWEYHAREGYTGKDAFVVQISGEATGRNRGAPLKGSTSINVDVDVVP